MSIVVDVKFAQVVVHSVLVRVVLERMECHGTMDFLRFEVVGVRAIGFLVILVEQMLHLQKDKAENITIDVTLRPS